MSPPEDLTTVESGHVFQIGPNATNPAFAFNFLVVGDDAVVKPWGVQGYSKPLGERSDEPPSTAVAYYRARWEEIEFVGKAAWTVG